MKTLKGERPVLVSANDFNCQEFLHEFDPVFVKDLHLWRTQQPRCSKCIDHYSISEHQCIPSIFKINHEQLPDACRIKDPRAPSKCLTCDSEHILRIDGNCRKECYPNSSNSILRVVNKQPPVKSPFYLKDEQSLTECKGYNKHCKNYGTFSNSSYYSRDSLNCEVCDDEYHTTNVGHYD